VHDWAGLNTPGGDPDECQPAVNLLHDKTGIFESVHTTQTYRKTKTKKIFNKKTETKIEKKEI